MGVCRDISEEVDMEKNVESLVDILMNTRSVEPTMHHTRTSGTPYFWTEALGREKSAGPLTDEDIDIIAKAKEKDPPSAHEIIPNLFLGNKAAAENTEYLKTNKITHLLNMGSDSKRSTKFFVVPDKEGLEKEGIELKSCPEWRDMKIIDCFAECTDWIQKSLDEEGRVLVVCWQGASRSAAIVLAFLVRKMNMRLEEAVMLVKRERDIRPNNAFLQQLIDYEASL